eukprot:CAMPEP_0117000840 /NCGR_PEP_ID=MMETSP0472-20121206/3041_1 /TAXON_ID=693140 ORGANISM="Tiarina fusus, Strain LIS" /NCGR_SAMPLE_ID=MMETSP0472 /ASSEMBLY_ACC=CAM_ASM_000603 /LENGTH=951 /DNA_ID=CAMNT_0004700653 /DNA_START=40 /DNA_END=2895 /DNA_ORIENTATION=-
MLRLLVLLAAVAAGTATEMRFINSTGSMMPGCGMNASMPCQTLDMALMGLDLSKDDIMVMAEPGLYPLNGHMTTMLSGNASLMITTSGGSGAPMFMGGSHTLVAATDTAMIKLNGVMVMDIDVTMDTGDMGMGAVARTMGNATLMVNNTVFQNNTASMGGALAHMSMQMLMVESCSFLENQALLQYPNPFGGLGGAIYVSNSMAMNKIMNSNFVRNSAIVMGSGSGGNGGAIYIQYDMPKAPDTAVVTFMNNVFTENKAVSATLGYGGAVYIRGCFCTFNGDNFQMNVAQSSVAPLGGAVAIFGGLTADVAATQLNNCILMDNHVKGGKQTSVGLDRLQIFANPQDLKMLVSTTSTIACPFIQTGCIDCGSNSSCGYNATMAPDATCAVMMSGVYPNPDCGTASVERWVAMGGSMEMGCGMNSSSPCGSLGALTMLSPLGMNTIHVMAGTYVITDDNMLQFEASPTVMLMGAGMDKTFFVGGSSIGNASWLSINGNSNVTVMDLTVMDYSTRGAATGAAIRVEETSMLMVMNCMFKNLTASSGGAISAATSGTVKLMGTTFFHNNALALPIGGFGGAVEIFGANIMIDNCVFNDNLANDGHPSKGGSLFIGHVPVEHKAVVMNTMFFNNTVGSTVAGTGGAVGIVDAAVTFTSCTFTLNVASGASAVGAGVAISSGPNIPFPGVVTFDSCTFTNNHLLSLSPLSPPAIAISATNMSWVVMHHTNIYLDCVMATACFTCVYNQSCGFNETLVGTSEHQCNLFDPEMFPKSNCGNSINGTMILELSMADFSAKTFATVLSQVGHFAESAVVVLSVTPVHMKMMMKMMNGVMVSFSLQNVVPEAIDRLVTVAQTDMNNPLAVYLHAKELDIMGHKVPIAPVPTPSPPPHHGPSHKIAAWKVIVIVVCSVVGVAAICGGLLLYQRKSMKKTIEQQLVERQTAPYARMEGGEAQQQ